MTLYNSESGDISMVLTGESLISRRMRVFKEERFTRMREIIQGGDVSFTNAEMLFHDYAHSPNPHQLGTYMRSDPANIKELQWLGINLVSCSNNHAYDFGEGGVLENIQQLDDAGLAHAGSGRNLAEARAPAYLDTDAGRVALISVTDSGPAESRAGEQRRDMLGRPGVSWLRSTAEFTVDRPTLDALRRMSEELGFEDQKRARGFDGDSDSVFHLMGQPMYSPNPTLKYVLGESFSKRRVPDPYDMDQILQRVSDARRMADWVIVTMHNHEGGATGADPGDHAVALAKAAIDHGADVYVGHGPHRDRGMEVYKGKPIFHSLGDFVMQNDTVELMPQDNYLRQGLGWDAVPADFYDARSALDTKGMPADPLQWRSTMARVKFEDHRLTGIELIPLDLGFLRSRGSRGRPLLAGGETAELVLEGMRDMSSKYGTSIKIEDGTATVEVG